MMPPTPLSARVWPASEEGDVNISLFDGLTDGLQRVMDLRREQHALTAANLANADTPGYLAKEIPFDELLSQVVEGAERGEAMPVAEINTLEAPPGTLDGNSVSAERESVRLTENLTMYNAIVSGTSRRLGLLRYAVSDGRG